MIEIGEITLEKFDEVEQYCEIDWTIKDIFSYTEQDKGYESPALTAFGLEWYFEIYPDGVYEGSTVGWIGLYLRSFEVDRTPKSVNLSFGVRKVDGKVEVLREGISRELFPATSKLYCGEEKLLERSKLSERRSELAPSGVLILTCILRVNERLNFASRLVNLSANLKKMFVSKIGCDATLKVQNEEFSVHKAILASRSSVFETMFQTQVKEKHTEVVDIDDCHPAAFRDFLVYVYSGELENSSNDIFELFRIAHKYCVEELKDACALHMNRGISLNTVIDVVILSRQYDVDELKTASQDFFDGNVASVFRTDKWKSLLRSDPTSVQELLINMTENVNIEKNIKKNELYKK